jgi:plastocyanin
VIAMRVLLLAALLSAGPASAPANAKEKLPPWLAEQMPLQLPVHTPEDLAFKAVTERQYLFFTLLAAGKVAWDHGDFQTAASKWEALLRTPELPAELDLLVRPLAVAAREKAGGAPAQALPPPPDPKVTFLPMDESKGPRPEGDREAPARVDVLNVTGTVGGGGSGGPGGAVVMLRRLDGKTPKPRATRVRAVVQKDKRFVPHVLAVPVGAIVEFRNDDDLFHNVFSLSKPNDFDLGLYKGGAERERTFDTPGPVQLLCNIHSFMNGYVYVVDSPWFAQADAAGRFTVKNVPAGRYELEVWHEWSSHSVKRELKVFSGMEAVSVTVDGDKRAPAFVPDKAGKPRQPQLGY